jgi:hypothetical protein
MGDYVKNKKIGTGYYGEVFSVRLKDPAHKHHQIALKVCLSLSFLPTNLLSATASRLTFAQPQSIKPSQNGPHRDPMELLEREIKFNREARSNYIVPCYGVDYHDVSARSLSLPLSLFFALSLS